MLSQLSVIDVSLLTVDVLIIAGLVIYYFNQGNNFSKCRKIEISTDRLFKWRISLYSSIFSTWIISFLIFVVPSAFSYVFHLIFLLSMNYLLNVSIPAYVCKKLGYGGTCNCDFYEYNDFEPMIALGIVGNLIFVFFNFNFIGGIVLLLGLGIISGILSKFLPKRELEPLKYPPHLLISEIDQLQAYLMTDPSERKLLTVVDAKCDFCEIQIKEILQMPEDIRNEQLRIFDLTYSDEVDPIIPMHLNMNTMEKIPVPTTFIFDGGMAIEQKDGVLSKTELEYILIE